jgi:predicted Zn-ribbon and HTH transcriptional regulator
MLGDRPLTRASALMVIQKLRSKQPESRQTRRDGPGEAFGQVVAQRTEVRVTFRELAKLVPAGRYAVTSATGNNDLDFYLVQVPDKGKWAGKTFVKRILGGHDPMPMSNAEQFRALRQIIEAGTEEAGMKYALESGNCRDCGRELTDQDSRDAGRGPVCRSK